MVNVRVLWPDFGRMTWKGSQTDTEIGWEGRSYGGSRRETTQAEPADRHRQPADTMTTCDQGSTRSTDEDAYDLRAIRKGCQLVLVTVRKSHRGRQNHAMAN